MKVLYGFIWVITALVMAACSSSSVPDAKKPTIESKTFDYKAPPVKARALDIPPDLTSYSSDDRFAIPGEGESGTRYSDYIQSGKNRKLASVLPQVKNVHLERNGVQRWLVIDDRAENVWPVVKAFWYENGLTIKNENPQAGVIETDWAENRAKLPMDVFRKYFGKVFSGLLSTGEKDQYHTRLERSKDGNSTEIYINHYGMQEVESKDNTGFQWRPRPTDPELEATMLQLLMSKLSGGSGVIDKSTIPEGATEAKASATAKLNKLDNGSQIIVMLEPFDKSWRKVGLALDQAGIALADKDRTKGTYFLSTGKDDLKIKPGSENILRKLVIVKETTTGCEVRVEDGAGGHNADTQKIIESLFKSLTQL